MNRADVQGTLREMWETRPARARADRQVAGVAAGIARRYDIDPVLVRVGFVVAAFSGIGAALYVAGWILLPEEPRGSGTPARGRVPRTIMLAGLAIATVFTVESLFRGDLQNLLPLLAVGALLFLLHRSRRDRGPVEATPGAAPATAGPETTATAAEARTVATPAGPSLRKEEPTHEPAPAPPSWDPLGAAPFAWDLPEPSPPPPPAPRRRAPVTGVTLGLALVATAVTTVVMLVAGGLSLAGLPVLFGVPLAVLGAGLVVGAFLRAGRGLIPIALVLSALTWAVVSAPLDRWQGNGFGELRAAPTTVAEVRPSYERTAGDIRLDLRAVDLAVPPGGNSAALRPRISLGAGNVEVLVPPNADVTLDATAGVGSVAFGDREVSGPGSRIQVTDDLGADGVRSGRELVLLIEAGAGDVEVRRG
ncbi:PspC domain-containing protein [Pseudonocardia nigra]|uniref:PspC domain-containing protein n=1 Tax=Pseudonocardia nigra TaxID=1921578 RepID=UPI001C5DDC6C|nr:PspC domain-containing protein [Pseudonocardia nigra]